MSFYEKLDASLRKQMSDAFEFARLMSGARSGSTADRAPDPSPLPAVNYTVKNGRIVPKEDA